MVQKPTIYLYGKDQVPLPKLPDWDKEKYPCAIVVYGAFESIILLVSDSFSCDGPSINLYSIHAGENPLTAGNYKKYLINGTEFVEAEVEPANDHMAYNIIWSNCNLYRLDIFDGITDELMFGKDDDPILDATEYSYCLCNGVLFPAFPELPYQYSTIANWDGETLLFCSTNKFVLSKRDTDGELEFNAVKIDASAPNTKTRSYCCTGAGWIFRYRREGYSYFYDDVLWSNHDIIDVNGTVGEVGSIYFPKSADPVPFEPEPQLNPAALMQGFTTMLSLRRNRNG